MQFLRRLFFILRAYREIGLHAARESWRVARRAAARRGAALAFNSIHTFTYVSRARWMCPSCNQVHEAIGTSPFSGLQFPRCCTFSEGHRLDQAHCTGSRR